jgi:hypothetical protein
LAAWLCLRIRIPRKRAAVLGADIGVGAVGVVAIVWVAAGTAAGTAERIADLGTAVHMGAGGTEVGAGTAVVVVGIVVVGADLPRPVSSAASHSAQLPPHPTIRRTATQHHMIIITAIRHHIIRHIIMVAITAATEGRKVRITEDPDYTVRWKPCGAFVANLVPGLGNNRGAAGGTVRPRRSGDSIASSDRRPAGELRLDLALQKWFGPCASANELAPHGLRCRKYFDDVAETRWLLAEQLSVSLPTPFLILLTFWSTAIFFTFGLFAPPNATVLVALFVCALSISAAILLILELDKPFGGLIRLSFAPLSDAYRRLCEGLRMPA